MPIYEYRCNDCGRVFEAIQKFSDKPLKKCVHCAGGDIEKLISRSSFVLKGTGWYQTDYARKEKKGCDSAPEKTSAKPACAGCPAAND